MFHPLTRRAMISPTLLAAVRRFEGCRLTAYRDSAGVWTVGYGSTQGVRPGLRISPAEAERRLLRDLGAARRQALALTAGVALHEAQLEALTDFVFNLGAGNLARSALLRRVRSGAAAAEVVREFRRWVYAGGRRWAGLVARREWEAARWTAGAAALAAARTVRAAARARGGAPPASVVSSADPRRGLRGSAPVLAVLFGALWLSACCPAPAPVVVQAARADSVHRLVAQHDTVSRHDSIVRREYRRGDTVFVDRHFHHRIVHHRLRIDTLRRSVQAERTLAPAPAPAPTLRQRLERWLLGGARVVLVGLLLLLLLPIAQRIWRKIR